MPTGLNSNLVHRVNLLPEVVVEYMLPDPKILVKHSSVIGKPILDCRIGCDQTSVV